jgi:DNA-binding NarL/FixJ family response regulator
MSLTTQKTVRLYVVEEQEIYQELYKVIFPMRAPTNPSGNSGYSIELLEGSGIGDIRSMRQRVSALKPDVLLLSTKKLERNSIAELEQIRVDNPKIGLALFLVSYIMEDIELLRKLALRGEGGMALFLKQSVDLTEQLRGIIIAVSQGQVILDPTLTAFLFAEKPTCPFLRQLTSRELEILSLLSKGYTNSAMAVALYIDIKTVEHHINSMYGKLKAAADFSDKHPRVSAARLYLEATGELLTSATPEKALTFSYSSRQ